MKMRMEHGREMSGKCDVGGKWIIGGKWIVGGKWIIDGKLESTKQQVTFHKNLQSSIHILTYKRKHGKHDGRGGSATKTIIQYAQCYYFQYDKIG